MTKLFHYRSDTSTDLSSALEVASKHLTGAVALVYTPKKCSFARLNGSKLQGPDGSAVADDAFEVRAFDGNCEFRWIAGLGASLIAESEIKDIPWAGGSTEAETADNEYVLWGKGTDKAGKTGWASVSSARIGTMCLPLDGPVPRDKHAVLKTVEYFAQFADGNYAVLDERLVALEVR